MLPHNIRRHPMDMNTLSPILALSLLHRHELVLLGGLVLALLLHDLVNVHQAVLRLGLQVLVPLGEFQVLDLGYTRTLAWA